MELDLIKLKQDFDLHGWVVIKNFFSKEAAEKMRADVFESQKELGGKRSDLLSNKRMSYIVTDEKLISVVKALLATDNPVYFSDSSYIIGNLGYGFHKDNPDRLNPNGVDWSTNDYPCIRMATYLQDHVNHSGTLALRDKSHNIKNTTQGKAFFVPSEPGDLILWSLRTTHSGNSKRLKLFPNIVIEPMHYRFLPNFLFKPEEKLRVGVFLTFGKKSPLLDRYFTYLKNRTYMVKNWIDSATPQEQIDKLKSYNVDFINFYDEAKKIDIATTSADHYELN